jgi:hypothetical protein
MIQSLNDSILHPLQRTFFPDPDVADDQDRDEDQHLEQAEQTEGLELHRPGKEEDRFHVEHDEKNRDDVITHRVAAARIVDGINAALVRHQFSLARILRPDELGQQQREWKENKDYRDKNENRNVILWHKVALTDHTLRAAILTPMAGDFNQTVFPGVYQHGCLPERSRLGS